VGASVSGVIPELLPFDRSGQGNAMIQDGLFSAHANFFVRNDGLCRVIQNALLIET